MSNWGTLVLLGTNGANLESAPLTDTSDGELSPVEMPCRAHNIDTWPQLENPICLVKYHWNWIQSCLLYLGVSPLKIHMTHENSEALLWAAPRKLYFLTECNPFTIVCVRVCCIIWMGLIESPNSEGIIEYSAFCWLCLVKEVSWFDTEDIVVLLDIAHPCPHHGREREHPLQQQRLQEPPAEQIVLAATAERQRQRQVPRHSYAPRWSQTRQLQRSQRGEETREVPHCQIWRSPDGAY